MINLKFRLANGIDKNNLYALWQKTFKDTTETIDLFFKYCYENENTIVCENDNSIIAMLYLIPSGIIIEKKQYSAYYIYAAATDDNYRKCGIMSSMLEFCDEILKQRKTDFVFLRPANDKLYDYYHKRGFETRLYSYKTKLSRKELENIEYGNYDYIDWNNSVKKLDCSYSDGCKIIDNENCYARVYITEHCAMIKNVVTDNIKLLVKTILSEFSVDNYELELPVGSVRTMNGEELRAGQIKSLNNINLNNDVKIYLGISLE